MSLKKVTSTMLQVAKQQSIITAVRPATTQAGNRLFGMNVLKNYPELIPLVAILGVAVGGASFMSVYALATKSDVNIAKGEIPPWEKVDPNKKQKLIVFETEYKANRDLEDLRKEIGSYRT